MIFVKFLGMHQMIHQKKPDVSGKSQDCPFVHGT